MRLMKRRKRDERSRVKMTSSSTYFKPHKICCGTSGPICAQFYSFSGLPWPHTCITERFSLSVTFLDRLWKASPYYHHILAAPRPQLGWVTVTLDQLGWEALEWTPSHNHVLTTVGASLKMKAAAQTAINKSLYQLCLPDCGTRIFKSIPFCPRWVRSCSRKTQDDINTLVLHKVSCDGGRWRGEKDEEGGMWLGRVQSIVHQPAGLTL